VVNPTTNEKKAGYILMHEEKTPKVSVCVVTYNQENFIRQCLQSIVDQETDFDFEVIVGDDGSADGTRAIVQEFAERYPSVVRPIFHEKNIGFTPNYLSVHTSAKGEYVAQLDGDDYMLPGKLRTQVEVLNSRPNISLSAHACRVVDSERIIGNEENLPEFGTIDDLVIYGSYFIQSSVMYRRANQHVFDGVFLDNNNYLEHAKKGGIHLIKEPFGVYREHPQGISKRKDFREILYRCNELFFHRAIELGVPSSVVRRKRLVVRRLSAITYLEEGGITDFKEKIFLNVDELRFISFGHLVLFGLSLLPKGSVLALTMIKLKRRLISGVVTLTQSIG
jgi:glycosyltransferase involved in cell wall biosynthesis